MPRQTAVRLRSSAGRRARSIVVGLVALLASACAGTVQQAAKGAAEDAAPAAVEGASAAARDPQVRDNLAQILGDPQIRAAVASLAEAMLTGAVRGLGDPERVAQVQRLTDMFVSQAGVSLARSLRTQIGPELTTIVANAVDRSLERALSDQNQAHMQAFALALTRASLQGVSTGVEDASGRYGAPLLAAVSGMGKDVSYQAAFGIDTAMREAQQNVRAGAREGRLLAAAATLSDLVLALPTLLWVTAAVLGLALSVGLIWGWRSRQKQHRIRRRHTLLLGLAREVGAEGRVDVSDGLRVQLAEAAAEDPDIVLLAGMLTNQHAAWAPAHDGGPRSAGSVR